MFFASAGFFPLKCVFVTSFFHAYRCLRCAIVLTPTPLRNSACARIWKSLVGLLLTVRGLGFVNTVVAHESVQGSGYAQTAGLAHTHIHTHTHTHVHTHTHARNEAIASAAATLDMSSFFVL